MFLLIRKILSLSFVNIKMEIMSLLYYLLNRGIMSLETMSPSAMGIRTYGLDLGMINFKIFGWDLFKELYHIFQPLGGIVMPHV